MTEANYKNVPFKVVNYNGEESGTVEISNMFLEMDVHEPSVQLAIRCQLSNQRQATAKTKTHKEVRGGGKKPFRQKGTGRARAGSTRSPIWVGGGTVFGPTGKQNYKIKVNKNVHNLALISALADKFKSNNVIIVDNKEQFPSSKTKDAVTFLSKVNAGRKTLIVLDVLSENHNENLYTAARNIENVRIVGNDNLSVYDIVDCSTLIIEKTLAPMFQEEN